MSSDIFDSVDKQTCDSSSTCDVNVPAADINNTITSFNDNEETKQISAEDDTSQFAGEHGYELINGNYYYTDTESKQQYKHVDGQWITVDSLDSNDVKPDEPIDETDKTAVMDETDKTSDVHVDEDGRTYYYADGQYLCKYPTGHVYYINENNEWVLWNTEGNSSAADANGNQTDASKWYFYRGDIAYYRDQTTNIIYKLNKESNEWEVTKGAKKRKKPQRQAHPEEEFDTESSNEEEEEEFHDVPEGDEEPGSLQAPPGYKNDPNISYDGTHYTKVDSKDSMTYEWDVNRRAWFPKVIFSTMNYSAQNM